MERSRPLVKLIDFRHVAKQDVLLVEQSAGDEGSQRRVVHLRRVALEFNIMGRSCTVNNVPRPGDAGLDGPYAVLTSSTHSSSSTYTRSVSSSSFIT